MLTNLTFKTPVKNLLPVKKYYLSQDCNIFRNTFFTGISNVKFVNIETEILAGTE